MLKTYLQTALRIHAKNRLYTFINFLGLSLAIMLGFMTYLYVSDEFSYDKFHTKGDQLFLLNSVEFKKDDVKIQPGLFDIGPIDGVSKSIAHNFPFLTEVADEVPEIEEIIPYESNYISVTREANTSTEAVQYVGERFFSAFGYRFLSGDAESALSDISSVVVTKAFALRHFGSADVLGKTLVIGGDSDLSFVVSGVIELPKNTVLRLNIVLRSENSYYYKNFKNERNYNALLGFALLRDGVSKAGAEDKIRDLGIRDLGDSFEARRENLNLSQENPVIQYELTNVSELYLNPTIRVGKSSSKLYSYILIAIAVIILMIASINYLSISIASSAGRRTEISIRKVVGAGLFHLRTQFYAEAMIITMLAVFGGFTMSQLLMPRFNELAGKDIQLSVNENLSLVAIGLLFGFLLAFIAGSFPAQVLSRFRVLSGLKGKGSHRVKPGLIRAMVIFQFTMCLVFISMSLTMHKQFDFISNKDLGFDKEQVVYVSNVWGISHLLKEELTKEPSIQSAAGASGIFLGSSSFSNLVIKGLPYRLRRVRMDQDFFETMGLSFVDKEGFPVPGDNPLVEGKDYLNEYFFSAISEDSVTYGNYAGRIGGIIKDFHFESLQNEIGSISFRIAETSGLSVLFVKLKPGMVLQGIQAIKNAYASVTDKPLEEVRFLDDYLDANYKDGQRWQKIVDSSTILGIVIACIGLFGLTGISMGNQIKEISIRKVLGASYKDIAFVLNRQTVMLIGVSALLSLPISYLLIQNWLDSFAYHIAISPHLFLWSIVSLFVIAMATVIYHSVKTVRTDPAKILRNE